ncbi:protein takeout [Cloeon dipterum]|uniref:protein takeout n=1 Tax=Cloeon dipterum TaxID=197152 RepID=UPI00321FD559
MWFASFSLFAVVQLCLADTKDYLEIPEYVKQCNASNPKLIECLKESLVHLKPYLAKGIPEIELPSVEPFLMDELSLSLSTGPKGYKITLKDLKIYGATEFNVRKIRLGEGEKPFEARLRIPKLHIDARYTSSGVLFILPALGGGTFNADFHDVYADVSGIAEKRISNQTGQDETYLTIRDLNVELNVKNVQMAVKKVFNNNRILTEGTNLFLRENGHEVLKHMQPQLKRKISALFLDVANRLLTHVPIRVFLVE